MCLIPGEAPQVQPSGRQRRGDPERHRSHSRGARPAGRWLLRTTRGSGAAQSYQTRRLKRFGDYTLSMTSPEPFDTDLVVPFPLEDAQESAATA